MSARPEILISLIEGIIARQGVSDENGLGIPMTPRDRGNALKACYDLRAVWAEWRTAMSGVEDRRAPVGPFVPGQVVVQFPRARQ